MLKVIFNKIKKNNYIIILQGQSAIEKFLFKLHIAMLSYLKLTVWSVEKNRAEPGSTYDVNGINKKKYDKGKNINPKVLTI